MLSSCDLCHRSDVYVIKAPLKQALICIIENSYQMCGSKVGRTAAAPRCLLMIQELKLRPYHFFKGPTQVRVLTFGYLPIPSADMSDD